MSSREQELRGKARLLRRRGQRHFSNRLVRLKPACRKIRHGPHEAVGGTIRKNAHGCASKVWQAFAINSVVIEASDGRSAMKKWVGSSRRARLPRQQ